MSSRRIAIGAFLAVAAGSPALADSLIVNGSFENYPVPQDRWDLPGFFDTVAAGSTDLIGWTVIQGCDVVFPWEHADGSLSIDMGGGPSQAWLQQQVPTVAGRRYVLRFAMAGNPDPNFGEPTLKTMDVQVDGAVHSYEFDVAVEGSSGSDMRWRYHEIEFVAGETPTVIDFINTMGVVYTGPTLDDVSVRTVCVADVDASGEVGFEDLLAVLAAWGPCEGCSTDIDDSGFVDFDDLLTLLSAWGPCPE